jgi:hypothetical protein
MRRTTILSIAFLLLLAAFPLISIGTTSGQDYLWGLGLALLLFGAAIPPITRFVPPSPGKHDTPDTEEEPS